MTRRIYLASSWRNKWQPDLVAALRGVGHEVYDFRNPKEGEHGFQWTRLDPEWTAWRPRDFVKCLEDPIACAGYKLDKNGLDWCDTCVILLPCGRSAHLEAGYCVGQNKETIVYLREEQFEPELMYLMCDGFAFDTESLLRRLQMNM